MLLADPIHVKAGIRVDELWLPLGNAAVLGLGEPLERQRAQHGPIAR
jgi:hypothetical protein